MFRQLDDDPHYEDGLIYADGHTFVFASAFVLEATRG